MSNFNRQPTLNSSRTVLRPMVPDDFAGLYAVASDPQIWAVHPAHDRWQEPVFRAFFEDGLASGGSLVASDPASGAIIGHSRYDYGRCGPGEIEIGWSFLARSHWGGATNAAMKALMIAHALPHHDRVIFLIGETNVRSRRAMEKIGGRLDPARVHDAQLSTGIVRHVTYLIDAASFAAGPLAGQI